MNKRFCFSRVSMCLIALIVVGVTLSIIGIALAATVSIDNFDNGDIEARTESTIDSSAEDYYSGSGILGTERDLYAINTTGGGRVSVATDAGGNGKATFNQDSNVQGWGKIVWDGVDGSENMVWSGLGGVDLTGGGSNDGFQVQVYATDGSFNLGLWVFNGAVTTNAYYTLTLPNVRIDPPGKSFFVPFSAFNFTNANASIFTHAGLVGFLLYPTLPSVDLTLDLFEADSTRDFGDLPETGLSAGAGNYAGLVLLPGGARHLVNTNLRLGPSIDTEVDGHQSYQAHGDDNAGVDDEDGVVATSKSTWKTGTVSSGNGGTLAINVQGQSGECSSAKPCNIAGWIDWNNDGDFGDAGEHIIDGETASTATGGGKIDALGAYSLHFNIPIDTDLPNMYPAGTTLDGHNVGYYARFRLCGGVDTTASPTDDCNSPGGESVIGEVEDYYIGFGTLAVNLGSFTATKAGDHNAIAWETTSELNNLGFNLWRGTSASVPDVKLNPYVIPSQAPGGTDGFAYSYNDSNITNGKTYYYWLEDVDLNGTVTRHGPVSTAGDAPTAVTLNTLQANTHALALPLMVLGLTMLASVGVVVVRRRRS